MKNYTRHAWRRFRSLGPVGWVIAGLYGGALAVMAAWALLAWEDSYATRPVDEIAYVVSLIVAVGCAGRAVRSVRGRRRYGWLALIVALSAWTAAEIIRIFEEGRIDNHLWHPSPTQAAVRLQHHPGLRAHPSAAGRRADAVDRRPHAPACRP